MKTWICRRYGGQEHLSVAEAPAPRAGVGEYDGRNSFEFGLELIIDGLARMLAKR
jgi:hypothetical protein